MWLEMSRDPAHGGHGWGFTECLWSPTHKDPKGSWPFWDALPAVKEGDTVFHLRGKEEHAAFVGYSSADAEGYITNDRPPDPGQWAFASAFYRVPLRDYVPFSAPISLYAVFAEHDQELRAYFNENKQKQKRLRKHIFYVIQKGKLQCLNGAYLSEFDHRLANLVLGLNLGVTTPSEAKVPGSVLTGEQLAQIRQRIGQEKFSEQVRLNYVGKCCFPGCSVTDRPFLVGSHIARWADAEELRGDPGNGLCLCLFHDKAFERGLFTLTLDFRVAPNALKIKDSEWASANIAPFANQMIKLGAVVPAEVALRKHWERIGHAPN